MDMEDLYRLLRTGHAQAQGIVDTVADPLLVLDSGLCVQNANRAFFETFKVDRDDTFGRRVYDLGNGQWDIPELRRLLVDIIPKSTAIINYEVEHEFPGLGRRTMLLTARTLFHPDSASHTMLLSIVDATDAHRRDMAKDMLFGELRHRMKNLLAVATSLARRTTTAGRTAEEYRDAFMGRFSALIDAQDMAFAEQGESGLAELLDRIFAPYDADAVRIEPSPAVDLSPRLVMACSLVFHELATNAAKYGALSVVGGHVSVGWQVQDTDGQVRIEWTESGGPPASAPDKTGYGTQLIRSTVSQSLRGTLNEDFSSGGYRAAIIFPLKTASHD